MCVPRSMLFYFCKFKLQQNQNGSMKKVVLVTGASSGIGKEMALQLVREGYIVYGAARRVEKMQDIFQNGGHVLTLDITEETSMVKAVQQVMNEQGRIDVLLNNAGYAIYGAVEDTTMHDARRQFDVNLFGLARITQLVLPHMREKKSGTIINISSMGGRMYTPLGAWYHATKHALEGWSDCLRLELKQFGIHVVVIEPGVIRTEFADVMTEPMLKRSGNTVYATLAKAVAMATENAYKEAASSPPSLVAQTVSVVVKAKEPRTRYVVGKRAKLLLFIRKYFGDRIFDLAIMSQLK